MAGAGMLVCVQRSGVGQVGAVHWWCCCCAVHAALGAVPGSAGARALLWLLLRVWAAACRNAAACFTCAHAVLLCRMCRWQTPSLTTSKTCWGARSSRPCTSGCWRAALCTCCRLVSACVVPLTVLCNVLDRSSLIAAVYGVLLIGRRTSECWTAGPGTFCPPVGLVAVGWVQLLGGLAGACLCAGWVGRCMRVRGSRSHLGCMHAMAAFTLVPTFLQVPFPPSWPFRNGRLNTPFTLGYSNLCRPRVILPGHF